MNRYLPLVLALLASLLIGSKVETGPVWTARVCQFTDTGRKNMGVVVCRWGLDPTIEPLSGCGKIEVDLWARTPKAVEATIEYLTHRKEARLLAQETHRGWSPRIELSWPSPTPNRGVGVDIQLNSQPREDDYLSTELQVDLHTLEGSGLFEPTSMRTKVGNTLLIDLWGPGLEPPDRGRVTVLLTPTFPEERETL